MNLQSLCEMKMDVNECGCLLQIKSRFGESLSGGNMNASLHNVPSCFDVCSSAETLLLTKEQ